MVTVKISDRSKALEEITPEWIKSTISRNRVMNIDNCVEINIDSENANLRLFAGCGQKPDSKTSNKIERRIVFLWKDLVLSKDDLNPDAIRDFLKRMDEWISFVPE